MKLTPAFLDAFQAIDANPAKKFAGSPPSQKLSTLLRPTIVAPRGKTLVWGDWSAIEARVLPWLAGSSGGESVLDIFRTNDGDPDLPDIYVLTAAQLLDKDPVALWADYREGAKYAKEARQAFGKVPVLSLGFGGGIGALTAMAVNYRVYLDLATATRVVDGWREANPWARSFWGKHNRHESFGLWGAACGALENPDTIYEAGRVAYVYDRAYLGGTLFCALPCGRLLTYPSVKWEWREVEDKKTGEKVDRHQLTYLKQYGRSALWHGKLAENSTQAAAASVLRRTLKRLDRESADWMPVVMHTHDEVVAETGEADEDRARATLLDRMQRNDDWDGGLPLKAEISGGFFYSKAGG